MSSDNASAAGEEPYRFISDLVAVLDDDSYPVSRIDRLVHTAPGFHPICPSMKRAQGIVWNDEGTHFKFTVRLRCGQARGSRLPM